MSEALKESTINSCSSSIYEQNYSIGKALLRDAENSNPLWQAYLNAEDYFRKLGGSGRFTGFCEWYPACIVLMTLLEMNVPNNLIESIKHQHSISLVLNEPNLPKLVSDGWRVLEDDESKHSPAYQRDMACSHGLFRQW